MNKYLYVLVVVCALSFSYFTYVSLSDTTVGLTLTTNPDLERGLVGHWTFDGEDVDWSSTTAEIRNKSSSTGHGNVGGSIDRYSLFTPGTIGQALRLSGTTTPVLTSDVGIESQSEGSLSFWIRVNQLDSASTFLNISPCSSQLRYIRTSYEYDELIEMHITAGFCGTVLMQVYVPVFAFQTWRHVTVVGGTGGNKFYVDGEVVTPYHYWVGSSATESWFDDLTFVGGYTASLVLSASSSDIELDDVRFYDRRLSADEIKRLYELGATTRVAQTLTTNPSLEDGLIGHWTFDGEDVDWSSTTAEIKDRSGQGNDGNASSSMTALKSPVSGVIGQAMSFDGVTNQITLGQGFYDSDTEGTISAWVKINASAIGTGNPILSILTGHTYRGISMFVASDGRPEFWYRPSTNSMYLAAITVLDSKTWHHIAVTSDGASTTRIYVNGTLENYTTGGALGGSWFDDLVVSGTPYDYLIGHMDRSSDPESEGYFDGSIDDVRIYDRSLSAEEIKRLYEFGATTRVAQTLTTNPDLEDGLVGHWTFDGPDVDLSSSTAEIKDRSINGNDADWKYHASTTAVGVLGQAVSLDGANDYIEVSNESDYDFDVADPFSISAWILRDTETTEDDIVEKVDVFNGYRGYALWLPNPGNCPSFIAGCLAFDISTNSDNKVYRRTAGKVITPGAWQHIVVTYDGSGGSGSTLYVNDSEIALPVYLESGSLSTILNDEPVHIGTDTDDTCCVFDGSLDDVRIYDRELSRDEIKRLYELGN